MDNLDSLSDSDSSSSLSTFSNLSGYQTEFFQLKQLINSDSLTESKQSNILATNIIQWYEKQITNLNNQLQNSLKQNERYKIETDIISKQKDISFNQKIEQLLKQNQFLEENLSAANKQIERLISIYNKKDDVKPVFLEKKILNLEKTNQELITQNFNLSKDKNEIENNYKKIKTEINELKLDLAAKNNIIIELKKKVSQQHVEIETISQEQIKLAQSKDLIFNELECVKKSEIWYKNQLKQSQQELSNSTRNNFKNEKLIATQDQTIEQLKLELSSLKCNYDEFKLVSLKEKNKIQTIDRHLQTQKPGVDYRNLQNHYESIIQDLTQDVTKIKTEFQKSLENITKEKSEYLAKLITEKHNSDEKQNYVEILESNVNDLKSKLSSILDRERQQNVELLNLRKTNENLKIELNSKQQDKKIFDESVTTIREQVKILMSKYTNLKTELQKRNDELLELQQTRDQMSLEKNLEISQLQQINHKTNLEIGELNEKIIYLEAAKQNIELEKNIQQNMIENLNNKLLKNQQDRQTLESSLKSLQDISKIDIPTPPIDLLEKTQLEVKTNRNSSIQKLITKFIKLSQKCKYLENKISENTNLLNVLSSQLNNNVNDEIQNLQIQLQVKLQEEKDKQKRYEKNYRTLLRKVKEHIKARKITEKHNRYLQQLHDDLANECNNLKLKLNLEQENHSEINTKLKSDLLKLEKKCSKLEELQQRVEESEKTITNYRKIKTDLSEKLQENDQDKKRQVAKLIQDNNKLSAKIQELECYLGEVKSTNENLTQSLDNINSKNQNEILRLRNQLRDIEEKNSHLLENIQHLNSCLQLKSEEINEFQTSRKYYSEIWSQKEITLTNLITELKKEIFGFKSELDCIRNEKFFLQRLCNDLKIALKTHVEQNQALRDILSFYKEKIEPESILLNFPSPVKFDDVYIEKLLEETSIDSDKSCDIDESLRALRKEILFLQQQIVEKNFG